jgi:hypothetical protein
MGRRGASTVSNAVSGINGVLATIGVGISLAGLTALFKRTLDEAKEAETANNELRGSVQNLGLDFDKLSARRSTRRSIDSRRSRRRTTRKSPARSRT